ncbi:MAG: PBS lyase, partial [Phycisphaerae bacterium]
GMMGGTKALSAVAAAAKSKDSQLQDAASRLLGEWMTEDAAPVLLELARLPGNPFQVRAIRGYIRIARQFVLPEEQRMEMCRTAFDASRQSAEKKLVLDVLKRY